MDERESASSLKTVNQSVQYAFDATKPHKLMEVEEGAVEHSQREDTVSCEDTAVDMKYDLTKQEGVANPVQVTINQDECLGVAKSDNSKKYDKKDMSSYDTRLKNVAYDKSCDTSMRKDTKDTIPCETSRLKCIISCATRTGAEESISCGTLEAELPNLCATFKQGGVEEDCLAKEQVADRQDEDDDFGEKVADLENMFCDSSDLEEDSTLQSAQLLKNQLGLLDPDTDLFPIEINLDHLRADLQAFGIDLPVSDSDQEATAGTATVSQRREDDGPNTRSKDDRCDPCENCGTCAPPAVDGNGRHQSDTRLCQNICATNEGENDNVHRDVAITDQEEPPVRPPAIEAWTASSVEANLAMDRSVIISLDPGPVSCPVPSPLPVDHGEMDHNGNMAAELVSQDLTGSEVSQSETCEICGNCKCDKPKANSSEPNLISDSLSQTVLCKSDLVGLCTNETNTGWCTNAEVTLLFSALPIEVIRKVFSYLSVPELCRFVVPVCKQWMEYAYDPLFWQQLSFEFDCDMSTAMLFSIVERAPLLHSLSLHGRDNLLPEEVSFIGERCPVLKQLDLGFAYSTDCEVMECLLESCRRLEHVNLEGCRQVDHQCILKLGGLTSLRSVNLSHCTALYDDSVVHLAQSLQHLQALNIDGISWVTDSAVGTLVSLQGASLKELVLDGAELTDQSIKSITDHCSKMESLTVSFAEHLSNQSLLLIQDISNLKVLQLKKGENFTSDGLRCMFQGKGLGDLVILDLSECTQIDDQCVLALTKCCGTSLHQLTLAWCWHVTDVGLEAIIDSCRNLFHLDLLGMDKIQGDCLDRIPDQMPHLKHLDLRQCNRILDDLIVGVIQEKRDLVVINYYGEQFCTESSEICEKYARDLSDD